MLMERSLLQMRMEILAIVGAWHLDVRRGTSKTKSRPDVPGLGKMTAIACIFIEILNQLLAYNAQYTLSVVPVFTQQETILFNRIINNNMTEMYVCSIRQAMCACYQPIIVLSNNL